MFFNLFYFMKTLFMQQTRAKNKLSFEFIKRKVHGVFVVLTWWFWMKLVYKYKSQAFAIHLKVLQMPQICTKRITNLINLLMSCLRMVIGSHLKFLSLIHSGSGFLRAKDIDDGLFLIQVYSKYEQKTMRDMN